MGFFGNYVINTVEEGRGEEGKTGPDWARAEAKQEGWGTKGGGAMVEAEKDWKRRREGWGRGRKECRRDQSSNSQEWPNPRFLDDLILFGALI